MPRCETCGQSIRRDQNGRNVCNCSTRKNGHALFPSCDLMPNSDWQECLCLELDEADRPCVSCESLMDSAAKGCAKCIEMSIARSSKIAAALYNE